MNADIARQKIASNGKLFDLYGNSSMGNLPRGQLQKKSDPTSEIPVGLFNKAATTHNLGVGSKTGAERSSVLAEIDQVFQAPPLPRAPENGFQVPPSDFLGQGALNPIKVRPDVFEPDQMAYEPSNLENQLLQSS